MRKNNKLFLNTIIPLILQITNIICGFILPRLFLTAYGSEVNGLVSSISQFLGIIAFLEMGVGAVIKFNLYKPLAEHDDVQISKVIKSANNFFRRIAEILLVYVAFLMLVYPFLAAKNFSYVYTSLLIASMCISLFAQYYFGQVNQLLLTADQLGYIQYSAQILTVIGNTVACAILIKLGAGVHIVKLTTSVIYLLRPLYLYWYVKRHYKIDRYVELDGEPIKQKWNGLAQHISAVVLDNTDVIVLTLFSSLSNVSIYYAYHLVVNGVKQLMLSMTSGVQAVLGDLYAREEFDSLKKTFETTEWCLHTATTYVFGCTSLIILPFISIYTRGINDANYYVPLFAILITIANASHCLRLPYNIMIQAAGHYKQTQSNFIIATIINIVASVILVSILGLIGVAIGTLVAMFYQTVWMAWYNSKKILHCSVKTFVFQIIIDIITILLMYLGTCFLNFEVNNYLSLILLAIKIGIISGVIVIFINIIMKRNFILQIIKKINNKKVGKI